MRHLLLALPLILGLLQDEARIDDLVRKLDDADLEVREGAVRDLVKAGAKALEPLRKALKSESAEVRLRATQALRTIENDLKARQVCPEHKPLALKRSGTVGEILDDLAAQTGAKFDAAPALRESKATVEAVTLLQALDQICASQDKLTFSAGEDGSIRFASDHHPKSPAAYFEGFKVFLTEIRSERKTDFKDATVVAQCSIHASWDPRLKPIRYVRYESLEVKDDAGRVVEVGPPTQNPLAFGGGIVMVAGMGMGGEVDLAGPQAFGLKGLVPEAKSLAVLKGKAIVSFPLVAIPVEFEDPHKGLSQTVGDMVVRLGTVSSQKNRVTVSFTKSEGDPAGLKEEILGRTVAGSVIAVDEEGKDHVAEFGPAPNDAGAGGFTIVGGGGDAPKSIRFQANFTTLGGKEIKRFKLKFSDAVFEKTVPFEIHDIKLP